MIFVDTSFWVALRNRRDTNHSLALQLFDSHAARGLVTSNHVLGETGPAYGGKPATLHRLASWMRWSILTPCRYYA